MYSASWSRWRQDGTLDRLDVLSSSWNECANRQIGSFNAALRMGMVWGIDATPGRWLSGPCSETARRLRYICGCVQGAANDLEF